MGGSALPPHIVPPITSARMYAIIVGN